MPSSPVRKPILCYVTDRHAFSDTSPEKILVTIRNAAAAGVDWIQIREKDLAGRDLVELVRLAIAVARGTGCRIFVNDRLDVALAANADGIHLGETSLAVDAIAEWRRSNSKMDFQIGVSCHSVQTARAAERNGADYIFFGPVFATPSKAAFGPPQGLTILEQVCDAVAIPVIAIGGVEPENAASCLTAGATGLAAIRMFQQCEDVSQEIARIRKFLS